MKITNILPAIVVALTLFASSCAKDIVDTTGTISGTTKDYDSRQTLADCHIALSPGGVSTTTNSTGTFEFPSLEPGDYSLLITKNGYKDNTQTVTVISGKVSQMDIFMQAKSPFEVSETNYDYGDLQDTKEFFFFNNCDQDCAFTISSIPVWLSFSKTSGTVKAMGNEAVTAVVDRSKVQEGEYSQNVVVEYSGIKSGVVMIAIKMSKVIPSAPTVSIASAAENIKENSFEISGTIRATGGNQITAYGHCWSTSPEPTINDSRTNLGNTKDLLTFKSTAENLSTYTTYYVRAYAQNALGVSYSDQTVVMTQDTETDKWDGTIATEFAGGSGTQFDPYIIKTGGQLLLAKKFSDANFKLAGNIDLNNHNWLPFLLNGTLDGNGFTISNLYIDRDDENQGLFSEIGGNVKNLTIFGVQIINGQIYTGTLAGTLASKVENCRVVFKEDSRIMGKNNVGGLVGAVYKKNQEKISITSCSVISNTGHTSITGGKVGGIVGITERYLKNLEISKCNVQANIEGEYSVGGILATYNPSSSLEGPVLYSECSYKGILKGSNVGGIIGANYLVSSSIISCKSDAKIISTGASCGGLVGHLYFSSCSMIASYATGTIEGDCICGGLVGSCSGNSPKNEICYSTVTSTISSFVPSNPSVYTHNNITTAIRESYSEYSSYYNFDNTWIWTGKVDGKEKNVSCPHLAWE